MRAVPNTYGLVDPDGVDSEGRDYIDITTQVTAQVGTEGLSPGQCVSISNILMYSYNLQIPQNPDEAVWATITVDILSSTAYASSFSTKQNTGYTGQLWADNPVSGSETTFSLLTASTSGVAVVNANGSFAYIPATNYMGRDVFTFCVTTPYGEDSADMNVRMRDAVSLEWMMLLPLSEE